MSEASLTRVGLPPNEQVIMCDRGFGNKTSMPAERGDASRYAPGLGRTSGINASLDIEAVTAPCGKQMGRFAMTQDDVGDTFFNYPLHTDADELSGEFEFEFVATAAGTGGNVETFSLRTDSGDVRLRWIADQDGDAHAGWRVVYNNEGNQSKTKTFDAAGPSNTGGEHSFRFVYTASSNPDTTDDGTLVVYMGANGESILDREAKGGIIASFTGWTKVVDISHANGPITDIRTQWGETAATGTNLSNTTGSGVYYRYLALYQTEDVPCTITETTQSWLTMHHLLVEKADIEWDATANSGEGGWDVRFGINWPDYLFDGSAIRRARIRVWTDYSDLGDNGEATFSDGGYVDFTADSEGYYRKLLTVSGLPADTPFWYDIAVQGDAGAEATWFYNSTDSAADVHGCLRTPQKPKVESTAKPNVRVTSCGEQTRWGPNEFTVDGSTIPVGSTGGARTEFRAGLGDLTYMDEANGFNKGGTAKEGAETAQQMVDTISQFMHSYSWQRAARCTLLRWVGDDHDRTSNDAGMPELLEENGLSWNRDRNGTNSAAWSDNAWSKRGVGANNPDYLFPCSIDDSGDEYQITPRALAVILLDVNRRWIQDTQPSSSGDYRFDPSSIDLYGDNQGVSTDTFDADDSQFSYLDMGCVRYLFLDTRLFMNRSNLSAGTLLGPAKTWVKSVISDSTLPGLVFMLPGYLYNVGPSATLKQNDNYATSDEVNFDAEREEVFVTTVDANTSIKWTANGCGDHHFVSIDDGSSEVSAKHRWQIGAGGMQAIRQEPDNIDSTGMLLLTDGSDAGGDLTSSDTVRTHVAFQVTNEKTGATTITANRVAEGGLEPLGLGSYSLPGLLEYQSRDRSRARGR